MMLRRFVPAVERAWYSSPGLLLALLPFEGLFRVVSSTRRYAFRKGWKRSEHPGVPVIVVGNLSAGGTGKTPTVIALVRALRDSGLRVAVISRGYGGSLKGVERLTETSIPSRVGEEPVLIFRSTGADVVVGADRVAAARLARDSGAQVIVSDDGLQHYRLARDIEIVTMDATVGFGNGHLLPVGPLRESPSRLESVDFLLQRDGSDPASAMRYRPRTLRRHGHSEVREVEAHGFTGPVHAVAAIARPSRFFDTLRGLGIDPIEHVFPDHHAFTAADFAGLRDHPIIVTAKDAVKLPRLDPPPWVLGMELHLPENFLEQVIERVKALSRDAA